MEKTLVDCRLILLKSEGFLQNDCALRDPGRPRPDPTAEASRADVATLAGHLLVQESSLFRDT